MRVCLFVSALPATKGTSESITVAGRWRRTESWRPRKGDSLSTSALFTDPDSANSTYAYLADTPVRNLVYGDHRDECSLPLGMSGELVTEDRYPVDCAARLEMLL
jgi:hypothetical protein